MASRTTLKSYFKTGDKPSAKNFADLIDSVLIQDDDGLSKKADGPLSVQAFGSDETLLRFLGKAGDSSPAWQLKQRPGGKAGLSIGDATGERLFIASGSGSVGIGTTEPKSPLSVAGALAVGASYAKLQAPANGLIVEGDVGIGTATPGASLEVAGVVRAKTFESTNELRHRMYPADPPIYQDIFEAKKDRKIAELGRPQGYNDTSYDEKHPVNGRPCIAFGGNNEADGNGALVCIPDGYDTVWVRVQGRYYTEIHAYFLDGPKEDLGLWVGGVQSRNCYCPDGTLSDGEDSNEGANGFQTEHQWLAIPARRAGSLALIAKSHTQNTFLLSGLAFSRNPWSHARQSPAAYQWALNGGDMAGSGGSENGNAIGSIPKQTKTILQVPVIPSRRDKLLYLIEYGDVRRKCLHTGITVNTHEIERFLATYDNPFARHWNSQYQARYVAARIPKELIPDGAQWLSVQIDMSKQTLLDLSFREIGTHDMDVPWS